MADHAQRLEAAEVGAEREHAVALRERLEDRLDAARLEPELVEALLQQVDAVEHRRRERVQVPVDVAPSRGAGRARAPGSASSGGAFRRSRMYQQTIGWSSSRVARRPAASASQRIARSCQRLLRSRRRVHAVGGAAPLSAFMAAAPMSARANLARGDRTAALRGPASRATWQRGEKRSRAMRPGATGARNLTTEQARRTADRSGEARLASGRLEHFGQQRDARQHRPAREVAGERRMVGADLERCASSTISLIARSPCRWRRRQRGEPRRGELAGRLARQRIDVDDAARQERRVDALAQRGDDLARARAAARRRTRPGERCRWRRRRSRAASRTRRRRRPRSS